MSLAEGLAGLVKHVVLCQWATALTGFEMYLRPRACSGCVAACRHLLALLVTCVLAATPSPCSV